MTFEEYKAKKKQAQANFEKIMSEIDMEYISSFAYKPGDIITDHYGVARIISVDYYYELNGNVLPKYYCDNLTKKGEIKKKEPNRYVYHSNIINKK